MNNSSYWLFDIGYSASGITKPVVHECLHGSHTEQQKTRPVRAIKGRTFYRHTDDSDPDEYFNHDEGGGV
jgi:hypothetical protein